MRRRDRRVLATLQGDEGYRLIDELDELPDPESIDRVLDQYDYLTAEEEQLHDEVYGSQYDEAQAARQEYDDQWQDANDDVPWFYDDDPSGWDELFPDQPRHPYELPRLRRGPDDSRLDS